MAQVMADYWFQSWSSQNNADQIAVKPLATATTWRQPGDQADSQISRGECFELQTMHLSFLTQFTPAANEQAMQRIPANGTKVGILQNALTLRPLISPRMGKFKDLYKFH